MGYVVPGYSTFFSFVSRPGRAISRQYRWDCHSTHSDYPPARRQMAPLLPTSATPACCRCNERPSAVKNEMCRQGAAQRVLGRRLPPFKVDLTLMAGVFFSQPFTVCLSSLNTATPRAVRRIGLSADVLKSSKIFAGDVLLVRPKAGEGKESYAVGIAWPSSEVDTQCLSSHALLRVL